MARLCLVERLALLPVDGGSTFHAGPARNYTERVFGGHTLAQACLAASTTVEEASLLCSFKAYFLSPGAPDQPIEYRTRSLHDGRTLAIREVEAFQGERQLLSWQGMFSISDNQERPIYPPAPRVPSPEHLPTLYELRRQEPDSPDGFRWVPGPEWKQAGRPFDVRYVGTPEGQPEVRCYWMRAEEINGATQNVQRAVLAFASDHSFAVGVSHARGDLPMDTGHRIASLDHDMWFHRDVTAGNWYLYVQRSPFSTNRSGLVQGSLYDQDRHLVATTTQQVLHLSRPNDATNKGARAPLDAV